MAWPTQWSFGVWIDFGRDDITVFALFSNPVNPMDYPTLPPMDFTTPLLVEHRTLPPIGDGILCSESFAIANLHTNAVGFTDDWLHSQVRWYSPGIHASIYVFFTPVRRLPPSPSPAATVPLNIAPSVSSDAVARRNCNGTYYRPICPAGFTARIRLALGGDTARKISRRT